MRGLARKSCMTLARVLLAHPLAGSGSADQDVHVICVEHCSHVEVLSSGQGMMQFKLLVCRADLSSTRVGALSTHSCTYGLTHGLNVPCAAVRSSWVAAKKLAAKRVRTMLLCGGKAKCRKLSEPACAHVPVA